MDESRELAFEFRIEAEVDLVQARIELRDHATELGMGLACQTKLLTATSELARNALVHAGGGWLSVATLKRNGRVGVEVVVRDRGPGIADLQLALQDHYSSGEGPGLGLGGARRLVDEFELSSEDENGTRVAFVCWHDGE